MHELILTVVLLLLGAGAVVGLTYLLHRYRSLRDFTRRIVSPD